MPRTPKTEKFIYYHPRKNGDYKDKILLTVNHSNPNREDLTLRDLLDYLEKHSIEPSRVKIFSSYITTIAMTDSTP